MGGVPLEFWAGAGLNLSLTARWPESVKLAVNISPVQFRSRNLVQVVISGARQCGAATGAPRARDHRECAVE